MTEIWKWYRDEDQSTAKKITKEKAIHYLEECGFFKPGTVDQCINDLEEDNLRRLRPASFTLRTSVALYRFVPSPKVDKP